MTLDDVRITVKNMKEMLTDMINAGEITTEMAGELAPQILYIVLSKQQIDNTYVGE